MYRNGCADIDSLCKIFLNMKIKTQDLCMLTNSNVLSYESLWPLCPQDFFLTVLYKRLVEGPVFHVITTDVSPQLRLYAHCARTSYYK